MCAIAIAVVLSGCRGATRGASSPHSTTTTTAASVALEVERVLVSEPGELSLVAKKGCVATLHSAEGQAASSDELRVRCPKPERLKSWFDSAAHVMASFAFEPSKDDPDAEDGAAATKTPWAKVLTSSGKTLKVSRPADVKRLAAEVRAFSAELASSEQPSPGPESPAGWQMLHVNGPAHVVFAGTPTRGSFDARMSTNGQYMCEFVIESDEGPMRASKSGWLSQSTAAHAIDEVLAPFSAMGPEEHAKGSYAAGTREGAEQRSNAVSTAEVFDRFSQVQDALGDACLPELEPPSSSVGL